MNLTRAIVAFVGALAGLLVIVPVVLLAFPLIVIATGTRLLANLFEPAHATRDQLIEFDPVFGWKPRPNLNTYHLMADLFRITTDQHGWRGRATIAESELIVFGDSFAAGYGIDDERVFANLTVRPRIKPIGIGGYSMVQELLWMQKLAPLLRGKLVTWFIYLGNDLYDNLSPELRGYRKPFVREMRDSTDWEIVSSHITSERWPILPRARRGHIHMATLAEICSDTFLARRAFRASEFLIRAGKRICDEADATLIVLTIPDPHQLSAEGHRYLASLVHSSTALDADAPGRAIEAICGTLDVPYVSGQRFLDLSCYKTNDCHWNERGHRKVAAVLTDLYDSWSRQEQKADCRKAFDVDAVSNRFTDTVESTL
jgi:hypothetical protein